MNYQIKTENKVNEKVAQNILTKKKASGTFKFGGITVAYLNKKNADSVVISKKDWQAIKETLFLLSVPGMRKSIREGLKTSIGECSEDLQW